MDLNELRGRVLKVNQAKPMKGLQPPDGNRASTRYFFSFCNPLSIISPTVWESEEWLQQYAKPLAQSGGKQHCYRGRSYFSLVVVGVQGRTAQRGSSADNLEEQTNDEDADAMEE